MLLQMQLLTPIWSARARATSHGPRPCGIAEERARRAPHLRRGVYEATPATAQSGRSSGVEHNLAKVGVEGSNPFARSSLFKDLAYHWPKIRIAFGAS